MAYSPAKSAKNGADDESVVKSPHSVRGILLIMLGSFSFSVMFLLVKVLRGMNVFTIVFWRSIVQILVSFADLRGRGENPLGPDDANVRWLLVMRAVFGAYAIAAWFVGIQLLPLPDAVTLQFTTPPFAAAFAVCIVGEKWMPLDIVGAIVCLSGVALIAHPTWLFGGAAEGGEIADDGVGTAMEAAAVLVTTSGAAAAGLAYVCVRKIGDRADAVVMVFYYGVLSLPLTALGSKVFLGTWNVIGDVANFTLEDYFMLVLVGLGGYGGQWFTNLGLQVETAATATLATSTQIVWTFVFEILFLHEELNLWSLGGTALILGYMMLVGIIKVIESREDEKKEPAVEEAQIVEKDVEEGAPPGEASPLLSSTAAKSPKERYRTVLQWQGSHSFTYA